VLNFFLASLKSFRPKIFKVSIQYRLSELAT